MSKTINFFELASLAEAAYVQFDKLTGTVEEALQDSDLNGNFSATQAADFVAEWEVVSHQSNTSSGFSATLFKNKISGEYVYAARGTEPKQWVPDIMVTDVGDIVLDGLAIKQIVDMYNDWQHINTPEGQTYQASRLVLLEQETELLRQERITHLDGPGPYLTELRTRTDLVIDDPSGRVCRVVLEPSTSVFSDERALGAGVLNGSIPLTVTGHSLGGHLATAFTRLFPETGAEAVTINGAGFMTGDLSGLGGNAESNINNLFASLGGGNEFQSTRLLNLFGGRGWEVTTMNEPYGLMQQGANDEIVIEGGLGNTLGHGKEQMTNALAVYDLFVRLDVRFRIGLAEEVLAELNPLFEATASDRLWTFESLVNDLGDLFIEGFVPLTAAQTGDREALFSRISAIRDVLPAQGMQVTTLVNLSADAIAARATTDIAYRYALTNLNPFAVTGDASLYVPHNTNGELDLINSATGQGTLSLQYLADRAEMLYWKLQVATADALANGTNPYTGTGIPDVDLQDRTSGLYLSLGDPDGGYEDRRRIIFGGEQADMLIGANKDDRLYGGAGDDIFSGDLGNDYLEGGKGRDTLSGGASSDILLGGKDFLDDGTGAVSRYRIINNNWCFLRSANIEERAAA